jgi:hypothetical protein
MSDTNDTDRIGHLPHNEPNETPPGKLREFLKGDLGPAWRLTTGVLSGNIPSPTTAQIVQEVAESVQRCMRRMDRDMPDGTPPGLMLEKKSPWRFLAVDKPQPGLEVLGYSPDWEHGDYNRPGVRVCFLADEITDRWVSSNWNNVCDAYEEDDKTKPTHWMPMPETNPHPVAADPLSPWLSQPEAQQLLEMFHAFKAVFRESAITMTSVCCDIGMVSDLRFKMDALERKYPRLRSDKLYMGMDPANPNSEVMVARMTPARAVVCLTDEGKRDYLLRCGWTNSLANDNGVEAEWWDYAFRDKWPAPLNTIKLPRFTLRDAFYLQRKAESIRAALLKEVL